MKILNKKAFTLIELIITISVMAILAVGIFVATKPQKRIGETNDAKRKNDAQVIEQSIKVMAADGGVMPSELKNLTENTAFAIVKAGGLVSGTYTCTALGSDISKKDISASLLTVIPAMPMDPDLTSSSNETGYYIVRRGSSYDVEPCNTYRIAATTGSKQMCGDGYCGNTESCSSCSADCGACPAVCGNGTREGAEVCDDGDLVNEGCGNNLVESAGSSYCNSGCSATITISVSEICDDNNTQNETCADGVIQNGSYCNDTCSATISRNETCEFLDLSGYCGTTESNCGTCVSSLVNCPSHESPASGKCSNCNWSTLPPNCGVCPFAP